MKHILGLVLTIIFLASCEQAMDYMMGIDVYDHIRDPGIEFNTLQEAADWVARTIYYKQDKDEYWQAPKTTINRGTGDCEDFCILLGWFARELGYRVYLISVPDGRGFHMILKIGNNYWEPQRACIIPPPNIIEKTFSYTEALERCYYEYGSRTLTKN